MRMRAAPAPTASKSCELEGEGESEEECVELEKRGRKRAQMSSGSNPKKRRKWNSDYIRFGFYLHQDESRNPFPSGKCFFCGATLLNVSLVPSKLERHLQTHHPEHKNKSKQFFSEKLKSLFAQQSSLQNIV